MCAFSGSKSKEKLVSPSVVTGVMVPVRLMLNLGKVRVFDAGEALEAVLVGKELVVSSNGE